MKLEPGLLQELARALRGRSELGFKTDIQLAARAFSRPVTSAWFPEFGSIENGDDTAVLGDAEGITLFAAEGMRAEFVALDPWFAGYSAVLVNVNDIAAMGGRPWAIVDVLFLGQGENERVLEGMAAASAAFGVPIVGGHTARVNGPTLLAAAVVGRARRVIPSGGARPGHRIVAAIDLRGSFRGAAGNFNAATSAPQEQLRAGLRLLPELSEAGLIRAGKDISMAGLCGTLLMLLEASACGAVIDLAAIPAPVDVDPLRWLTAFPSFGFVLVVEPAAVAVVAARFDRLGIACAPIGEIVPGGKLELVHAGERAQYWDLGAASLTGFGGTRSCPPAVVER